MFEPSFVPMFQALYPVVLASASPRRQLFLRELGLDFVCCPSPFPEDGPVPDESPEQYALRLAATKALTVAVTFGRGHLVIAADTVVVLRGEHDASKAEILGKPRNAVEALAMLQRLSGREHEVITGVHMVLPTLESLGFADTARVRFHAWPEAVLEAYVRTGEPFDKAGAYAIQGQGAFLVAAVNGAWSTVVGLPVTKLVDVLLERKFIKIF